MPEPKASDVTVSFVDGANAIEVAANNLEMKMHLSFRQTKIMLVKGTADIHCTNVGFNLRFDMEQQPGNPDYDIAPKIVVEHLQLSVSSHHTDIKLHGSTVTEIAKIILPLIQDSIQKSVVKEI